MLEPIRRDVIALLTIGLLAAQPSAQAVARAPLPLPAHAQSCRCGPDYCQGDQRYASLLAQKKQRLSVRFPAELVNLLDRDGHCVAAVTQGPDTLFIKRQIDGVWTTTELNDEREGYAKADLIVGRTSAYYKFNTARVLSCCDEPRYDERDDWDDTVEINKRIVLKCTASSGSVQCAPGI